MTNKAHDLSIVDRDWVKTIVNRTWPVKMMRQKLFRKMLDCSVSMMEGDCDGFSFGDYIFE
jgi:hypothetical protein